MPLAEGEQTPITREQVWSGLRCYRHSTCTAREEIFARHRDQDAQVEQYESSIVTTVLMTWQ
jgi:hypothetical protein